MNSTQTVIPILGMIVIGYLLRRIGVLKSEDAVILNKIVINIAIPSLIFLAMYSADLSYLPRLTPIPFVSLFIGVMCALLAYIFVKIRNYNKKMSWAIITTSAMANTGFLGYPIVLGVFGVLGLVRAVFYDMGSIILFISFGILLMFIFGGSYSAITKRALLFPPLWGIILGVITNLLDYNIGFMLNNLLIYLSGAAIPLIMISLGLSLDFRGIKKYLSVASISALVKLFISPLLAIIVVSFLAMGGLEKTVTIVEAAMPSAMLTLVLAITYELDINAVAACIFLSTLISILSIPVLLAFL
jgi:malate permease and related proteins